MQCTVHMAIGLARSESCSSCCLSYSIHNFYTRTL